MKTRIVLSVGTLVLAMLLAPAVLSYRVTGNMAAYSTAIKHYYLFGYTDCESNLRSWVRMNIQYVANVMQTTELFADRDKLNRLLEDDEYLQSERDTYDQMVGFHANDYEKYDQDIPPYFCSEKVVETHNAVLRMGGRVIGFYASLFEHDVDKTKSRLKGLEDVMEVILGTMLEDPIMKPLVEEVIGR